MANSLEKLEAVLDNVRLVHEFRDESAFMQRVLSQVSDFLSCDHSIFSLQHPEGHLDVVSNNIPPSSHQQYQDYWYAKDPCQNILGPHARFRLLSGPASHKRAIRLEDIVSYHDFIKTEFYNDFFRPHQHHYKALTYLNSESGVVGNIVLARPRDHVPFSEEDMWVLRNLSTCLVLALENIRIRNQCLFRQAVVDADETTSGTILCDRNFGVYYIDQQAATYFCDILGLVHEVHEKDQITAAVSDYLRKKELFGRQSGEALSSFSALKPVIVHAKGRQFCFRARRFEKDPRFPPEKFLIVQCEEYPRRACLDLRHAQEYYKITKREADIVRLLFKGLKNKEIAESLFISERTVKNHLQNIGEKVGASNRTEIIYKIIQIT